MKSTLWTDGAQPTAGGDGTMTGVIAAPAEMRHGGVLIQLALPVQRPQNLNAGRYLLARCGAQTAAERAENWQFYLRRPLFVAGRSRPWSEDPAADVWPLFGRPAPEDPGLHWLSRLALGQPVNVIGPNGNGFPLPVTTRRLLLLADEERAMLMLPMVEDILDRGGHVSLLLMTTGSIDSWRMRLPMAVELRPITPADWQRPVQEGVKWADQLCAALPYSHLAELATLINSTRLRLEPAFAFALPDSDLACGYGACLACVVPLANGRLSRACVHGPVFDLLELVRP